MIVLWLIKVFACFKSMITEREAFVKYIRGMTVMDTEKSIPVLLYQHGYHKNRPPAIGRLYLTSHVLRVA
jgi:hypothetical protein